MNGKSSSQDSWLLCRAGSHLCALPLAQVREVMRLLPTEPLADAPAFMRGISVVRGASIPILDLGTLLGAATTAPKRLVVVHIGDRVLGLALAEVLEVRRADQLSPHNPVPLLSEVAQQSVSSIGVLDSEALLFLDGLRVIAQTLSP